MYKDVEISLMDLLFNEVNSKDDAVFTRAKKVPVTKEDKVYGDGTKFVDAYYGFASEFARDLFYNLNDKGCFVFDNSSTPVPCYHIKDYDKLCAIKIRISVDINVEALSLGKCVYVFRVKGNDYTIDYNSAYSVGCSLIAMIADMVAQYLKKNSSVYKWIVTQKPMATRGIADITVFIEDSEFVLVVQN